MMCYAINELLPPSPFDSNCIRVALIPSILHVCMIQYQSHSKTLPPFFVFLCAPSNSLEVYRSHNSMHGLMFLSPRLLSRFSFKRIQDCMVLQIILHVHSAFVTSSPNIYRQNVSSPKMHEIGAIYPTIIESFIHPSIHPIENQFNLELFSILGHFSGKEREISVKEFYFCSTILKPN